MDKLILLEEIIGDRQIPADDEYDNNPTNITDIIFKSETTYHYPHYTTNRHGMSYTDVNGLSIFIGGEHEDYYDPNFCIYNDVITIDKDDNIKIYAYPKNIFPPTDFHYSIYVNGYIWIFGSIGYQKDRKQFIQICRLEVETMKMENMNNSSGPLWLWFKSTKPTFHGNMVKINEYTYDLVKMTWI